MKRLIALLALIALLVLPGAASATDTVTVASAVRAEKLMRYTFTFSSDDGTIARAAANSAANVIGTIVKVQYVPDGTNTPDAAADIQLYTHLTTGVNILYGTIDNVGATETIEFPITTVGGGPVFIGGETLYFYAGSLGAGTNAGVLTIWVLNP